MTKKEIAEMIKRMQTLEPPKETKEYNLALVDKDKLENEIGELNAPFDESWVAKLLNVETVIYSPCGLPDNIVATLYNTNHIVFTKPIKPTPIMTYDEHLLLRPRLIHPEAISRIDFAVQA